MSECDEKHERLIKTIENTFEYRIEAIRICFKIYDEKIVSLIVRLNAMDKALKLSVRELERRLQGLNELRNDVVTDRAYLVRKDGLAAYDIKLDVLDKWTRDVDIKIGIIESRYANRITFAVVLSACAVILGIVKLFI